jgi:uncharacterized membrane protein (UPF0127 family)
VKKARLILARGYAAAVTCAAVVLLFGCASEDADTEPDYSGLGNFDTAVVAIVRGGDTLRITAEIAETEDQRQLGLMERKSLPDQHGMIFVYDSVQDAASSFWMFRTRIPLDIAFVDSLGGIGSIQQMQPCESPNPQLCRTYPARSRYKYALEMNLGFFERHDVNVGDTVRIVSR